MFTPIQHAINVPGTLAADIVHRFVAPCDLTLKHISAVAENDSDATLKVGTSSDDDAYLVATAIGDSGVPVEFDHEDFIDQKPQQIRKGTVVLFTLDHDGSSGTAAQNVSIVATFTPG